MKIFIHVKEGDSLDIHDYLKIMPYMRASLIEFVGPKGQSIVIKQRKNWKNDD